MNRCPTCQRGYLESQQACPLDGARLAATEGTLPAGVGRVLGTYQLVGLIGEGGMGSLYVAAHTRLDRHVAIKVMRPELAHRRDEIVRFFDEAAIVSAIQHPNIVASIDTVEDAVDGVYCVLELLRGRSLAARIADGPLTIEAVIDIGAQIADALAAVHAADVVHRDVKPENVILVPSGDGGELAKLIDFGVAQRGHGARAGAAVGTAAYMAPEQAAGAAIDGRADVYSLGVMLFEMTTGKHPFPSTTDAEYVVRHAHDAPPRPAKLVPWTVPVSLASIIARCLRKPPADRYASAADVAAALRAVAAVERDRDRSRKWTWAAGGCIAVAAAGIAALVLPDVLSANDSNAAADPIAPPEVSAKRAPEPVRVPDVVPEIPDEEIELSITSTPDHATVFREGETVMLGTTPFIVKLARADRTIELRFELAGHTTQRVDVSLAESRAVTATLAAMPRVVNKPIAPKSRPPTVQREGVMDPFAPKR